MMEEATTGGVEEVDPLRRAYPQFDQQLAAMALMYEAQTKMPLGWEVLILPAVADEFARGYEDGWVASAVWRLPWGNSFIPPSYDERGRKAVPDGLGFVLGWSDCMIGLNHGLRDKALDDVLRWRLAVWRGFKAAWSAPAQSAPV